MDEDASEDSTGALVVDEDQDELMEEMSMEERKERLKRARWNVFLSLGLAAIMFAFALVPMPFSAEYDGFTTSAEKDLGYVWGLPLSGEGLFDVPVVVEVTANGLRLQPWPSRRIRPRRGFTRLSVPSIL